MLPKVSYRFGPYFLNPFDRVLLRSGNPVLDIDAQAFEVLLVLVRYSDEFVSKETFRQEAWKGLHIEDKALRFQIHVLRNRILVGSPEETIKIETKYKLGYKLCIQAERVGLAEITEADQNYLEGRYYWQKATAESIKKAIACFSRAVELDPQHAVAHSALADSWVLVGSFGHQSESALIAMPKAEAAARKALEIDPELPEARAALAAVHALYHWDWEGAKNEFEKAVESARNPMVRAWYALCAAAAGEHELSQREIDIAINRNPALPVLKALRARIYYLSRDFSRAIEEADNAIALEKYLYLGPLFKGHALKALGRLDEARNALLLALELSDRHPALLAEVGYINAVLSETKQAMKVLQQLESMRGEQYLSPHMLAVVNLGLGRNKEALLLLEETFAEKGAYLIFLATDPIYDPLRNYPEFSDLVRRVGYAVGN